MSEAEYNIEGMCWAIPLGQPQCDKRAEYHIMWYDERVAESDGHAMTAVCNGHRFTFVDHIEQHGRFIAEHEYRIGENWCDMPGTGWALPENVCILETVEPTRTIRGRVGMEVVEQWTTSQSSTSSVQPA